MLLRNYLHTRQILNARVVLIALLITPFLAEGQMPPPGKSKTEVAHTEMDLAQQQAKAIAQLAETKRQRQAESPAEREIASIESIQAGDRQRLLDRLAYLQADKVKRLNELASLQKTSPLSASNPGLQALAGPPPYSALVVDALRDELDGLRDKHKGLINGLQLREAEKQGLHEQLRRAEQALRLNNERLTLAATPESKSAALRVQEQSALRQQIAEAELAILDIDSEQRKQQAKHLQDQIDSIALQVTQAVSRQTLTEADLANQRARMLALRDKLSDELRRAEQRRQKHENEQQALLAESSRNANSQQQQFLELALSTDGIVLDGLNGIDILLQVTSDAWEKRYIILANRDIEQRRAAIASLDKVYQGLINRKRLTEEQRRVTQSAIREQEIRLANLPLDSPERPRVSGSIGFLQEQAAIHERLELAASLLERQLARWREDFASTGDLSLAVRTSLIGGQLRSALEALWQYELFAVEDMSSIDGRKVAVNYGVTVGKSVGAVLLFVFGYWLFSRLSRWLQRVLVRRFGISEQLASVMRRWMMILLAIGLLVFVLNLARIPLTAFAFMGGALAIGVGFGTQTIIKNFISGIIILFERKIRVGDIIELGGITGHVTAVDLRATTVRGFNGVEALVPNSSFLENQVINWTYSNPQIRRELRIGIAYGADSKAAETLLLNAAVDHPNVLKNPAPEVFFEDFGDSALAMSLVFWVELGPKLVTRRVDSELRHSIYQRLAAAGIAIPFPQRDVHLDLTRPLPVMVMASPSSA